MQEGIPMQSPRFTPALSNLPLIHQGKTRDTFECKQKDVRLIVATDRLSTHDVIHQSTIPFKGKVLTMLTVFWLREVLGAFPNHLVACGKGIFDYLPGSPTDYPDDLYKRAIVVQNLEMIPVEFIYRSYLTGSLYKKYYSKGIPNPYGVELPPGLQVMSPFQSPIFTPTDKSETDDPLNAMETRNKYLDAYATGREAFLVIQDHLRRKDYELVDSKFELGVDPNGRVRLADEVVTPDSSRFCDLHKIRVGQEPPWLDKQVARDEAERIWGSGPKHPLQFGPEIIHNLSLTYLEILWVITGLNLEAAQKTYLV
jgi:phosphoribosylaminoimidazole-succinocarboxamide synthase